MADQAHNTQDKGNGKSSNAQREERILAFWKDNNIFKKTLEKDSPKGTFIFYDGPPFATGTPHYGHILPGTMKDVIPRYKTMRGYNVPRVWGWDCHGLPIENIVEKELGLKSKKDIEDFGIEKFNDAARSNVLKFDKDWKEIIPRTGRFIDMDLAYVTMDWKYSESIWWSFKTIHDKGLIYQGFKAMHLCPHCETTLSNFEVSQGYKDITDISVYVKFELVDEPGTYVIAWTTTPWTLPGNVALAVNPEVQYALVETATGEKVIIAKERPQVLKENYNILKEFSGAELIGKKYTPVFPYYQGAKVENIHNGWKIVGADFVTTTDGTGIVHIAPGFGEDDYNLSLKEQLPFIQHVTKQGTFKPEVTEFAGMSVKPKSTKEDPQAHQKTDVEIIKYLAGAGLLFSKEKFIHSYPHCWRCDTPLLNYATSSWFVKVSQFKEKLVSENKKVNWIPEEIGEGRFGKWLENAKDWAISRSRFWGAPIPVWICDHCEKIEVVGSVDELVAKGGTEPKNRKGERDLHRPFIDEVTWKCSCGGTYTRVPEVFDTWYESGSMPYASMHYPFENTEKVDSRSHFPADFIAEGQDQTRGWFYSLLVLSSALFGETPYRNVIVNGTILAEDGQKMSKRLKNYPEITHVLDRFGADALRYYLLSSPAVKAEDVSFTERGLDEVVKKLMLRLENVYTFYATYKAEAGISDNSDQLHEPSSTHILDMWIIARLNELHTQVTESLEKYELDRSTKPFLQFVDDLSTWYLRRSRDRFKGDDAKDKQQALATTKYVLFEVSKLLAPFMPFIAEDLYLNITNGTRKESVHLETWSEVKNADTSLVETMASVRSIVSLALEARAKAGIKVRQPLQTLTVQAATLFSDAQLVDIVKDEVNVKHIVGDAKAEQTLALDTVITPELKKEGRARDLVRAIQDLRKASKLNPLDLISLTLSTSDEGKDIVESYKTEIMKTAQLKEINLVEGGEHTIDIDGIAFGLTI